MTLKTAVLLFCTISMAQDQPSQPKADIILLHGNIYTGVEVPSSFHAMQRVEALAIRGDRVQAAGTEHKPRSSIWVGISSCRDSTMPIFIWRVRDFGG